MLPAAWFIDLFGRWFANIFDTINGDRGWLTVASIIGAYFVLFGLVEQKHQWEENQAASERSTFFAMATSGQAFLLKAAFQRFATIQNMRATQQPSILEPVGWFRTGTPNRDVMHAWASALFNSCTEKTCTMSQGGRIDLSYTDLRGAFLRDINLSGANAVRANMEKANLTHVDLSKANLNGAYLHFAILNGAKMFGAQLNSLNSNGRTYQTDLSGADLRNADLSGADLRNVNLVGANLEGADLTYANLCRTDLTGTFLSHTRLLSATYNVSTRFPAGFDPVKAGLTLAKTC